MCCLSKRRVGLLCPSVCLSVWLSGWLAVLSRLPASASLFASAGWLVGWGGYFIIIIIVLLVFISRRRIHISICTSVSVFGVLHVLFTEISCMFTFVCLSIYHYFLLNEVTDERLSALCF